MWIILGAIIQPNIDSYVSDPRVCTLNSPLPPASCLNRHIAQARSCAGHRGGSDTSREWRAPTPIRTEYVRSPVTGKRKRPGDTGPVGAGFLGVESAGKA